MSSQLMSRTSVKSSDSARLNKVVQSYQADQQVKYLHLQAEIEILLQQLQSRKR